MDFELGDLSLKELKDLQVSVAKTIANYEDKKRKEALSALEAVAREKGFTLSELLYRDGSVSTVGTKKTRKTLPVEPKYRNPHNKQDTWSGRGRKPSWFQAALGAGKTAEDMLIGG